MVRVVPGTFLFYSALEQQADLEEGEVAAVEPIPAVQAIKAVQAVLGLGILNAVLLEQAGAVSRRQGQLLVRVWLEMGETGISCLSPQSCLHGLQVEVPAH